MKGVKVAFVLNVLKSLAPPHHSLRALSDVVRISSPDREALNFSEATQGQRIFQPQFMLSVSR